MKGGKIKILGLSLWLSLSIVLVVSVVDLLAMMGAIMNLLTCVLAVKKNNKVFDDFFGNML